MFGKHCLTCVKLSKQGCNFEGIILLPSSSMWPALSRHGVGVAVEVAIPRFVHLDPQPD